MNPLPLSPRHHQLESGGTCPTSPSLSPGAGLGCINPDSNALNGPGDGDEVGDVGAPCAATCEFVLGRYERCSKLLGSIIQVKLLQSSVSFSSSRTVLHTALYGAQDTHRSASRYFCEILARANNRPMSVPCLERVAAAAESQRSAIVGRDNTLRIVGH